MSYKDKLTRKSMKNRTIKQRTLKRQSISVDSQLKDKNMELSDNGNNKFIPKFKIINGPASGCVVMYLKKNQSVFDQSGFLNYCDNTIKVNTKSPGGFLSGLKRAFFTSQSYYMTYYTGTEAKESIACFSSFLPGDVIAVRIKPGESYLVTSHSFICATENIKLETKFRFQNILGGGGMFLTEISIPKDSDNDGMVWVASHGGFERIVLSDGESIKLEHGLFCIAKSKYKYELTTVGGLHSTFFSGQKFMMKFDGPCELYINSRDTSKFIQYIIDRVPKPPPPSHK